MPIFLERFVLPVLVTALIGVIVLNPFKFDLQQQLSLAVVVVALAYFVGHTIYRTNENRAVLPVTSTLPHVTGAATTNGANSPAVTGDDNDINYGKSDGDQK